VSFVLSYRIYGRKRLYIIGGHPAWTATAARAKAGELLVRIRDGHDPLEERTQRSSEPTLGDLAADYLSRHAMPNKRPKSVREDRRMLNNIILPAIGKLRLRAVGGRDIEILRASMKDTPYQGNRVLALLSKMFALAIEWKWTTENPVRGIEKNEEQKRECWLTVDSYRGSGRLSTPTRTKAQLTL
jgi:hypothetical protein